MRQTTKAVVLLGNDFAPLRAMGGGARDVACQACTAAGDDISIAFDRPGLQVQARSPTRL